MNNPFETFSCVDTPFPCHFAQTVVVMDGISERERREAVRAGLRVYAFAEVEGIGASHAHPHRPPGPNDLATFC